MENTNMEQIVETKESLGGKIKGWVKKNKKKLIVGGLIAAGALTLGAVGKSRKNDETIQDEPRLIESDFGRDCEMRFIVEETGEELGTVKCTESYANDMIEISGEVEKA